jgi:hypothetical protein
MQCGARRDSFGPLRRPRNDRKEKGTLDLVKMRTRIRHTLRPVRCPFPGLLFQRPLHAKFVRNNTGNNAISAFPIVVGHELCKRDARSE